MFSASMVSLMEKEDCIIGTARGSDRCLDITKLRSKINEKVIDIELFNQLLKQDCLFEVKSVNHFID